MISDKIESLVDYLRHAKAEGCLTEDSFDDTMTLFRACAREVRAMEQCRVPDHLRAVPSIDDPSGVVVPMFRKKRPSRRPSPGPSGGFSGGAAVVAGLMALGTLLLPMRAPAAAVPACAERESLVQRLDQDYGEIPTEWGLDHSGTVVELLRSPEGRSWSLLMTTPSGLSCLLASGWTWEAKKASPAASGSGARGGPS